MYNYYDNNEVPQQAPPMRNSIQLMHNYNMLPTASHPFMTRAADASRRNSLPKYENPWNHLTNNNNSNMKKQQQQQQTTAYDLIPANKNLLYYNNNNNHKQNLLRMQSISATPSPVRQLPAVKHKKAYHNNNNHDIDTYDDVQQQLNLLGSMQMERQRM